MLRTQHGATPSLIINRQTLVMEWPDKIQIFSFDPKELGEIFLLQTKSWNGVLVVSSAKGSTSIDTGVRPWMIISVCSLSEEMSQEIKNINDNMRTIRYELGTRFSINKVYQ